ncbi:hypothetical protein BHE74_00057553 [Ensete ventricosum]|nr:hypothetical protein GW17_00005508 [Ensete ventricosum]RWW37350.1 hypothetical protein BHE74_00057553 [Ensete ventricosum]RZS14600.1 hypothetical protein BHM03_00046306 [Ensete ventricosum]
METAAANERKPFDVLRSTVISEATKTSSSTSKFSSSRAVAGFRPCPGFTRGVATSVSSVRALRSHDRSLSCTASIKKQTERTDQQTRNEASTLGFRRGPHTWIEIGELPPIAAAGTEDDHKRAGTGAAAAAAARVEEVRRAANGGEQEPRNGAERRRARGRRKDGELVKHASAMLGLGCEAAEDNLR